MSRGEGRVYQRKNRKGEKSGPYWCEYYDAKGEQIRESTHETDYDKALKFLKRRIREVANAKDGTKAFVGPTQEKVKVDDILNDLVAEYETGGNKGIPRKASPQMLSQLKPLREFFSDMRALRVGSREVAEFKSLLKSQQKANATVNRSLQLLKQAYNHAIKSGKLSRGPVIELYDESDNVRKGKFTPAEAEAVFKSLPPYMADVARFAYESGHRSNEIRKLCWSHVEPDAIRVPGRIAKNRDECQIALTQELEEILERRKADRRPGCDLIFHHDGKPIVDYRKCWHSACVCLGLGSYYCRDCRDAEGRYTSKLDATKRCTTCGAKWEVPKYVGRIFHDFRRSAAHEAWKAGSTTEDCMEMTGHKTSAMFKRYADLFTDEEKRQQQRAVQAKRREWKKAQAANVVTMLKRSTVQ